MSANNTVNATWSRSIHQWLRVGTTHVAVDHISAIVETDDGCQLLLDHGVTLAVSETAEAVWDTIRGGAA